MWGWEIKDEKERENVREGGRERGREWERGREGGEEKCILQKVMRIQIRIRFFIIEIWSFGYGFFILRYKLS